VAVIVVVFALVLPKIASYGAVWDVARGLSAQMVVALLLVAALNILSFAPPWMVALPGLGFLNAVRVTQASTALSLVAPGGPAVGITTQIAMLRSWGLSARAIALAVGLVGLASQLAIYGLPVAALVLLTGSGGRNSQLDLVAVIGLAVFALIVVGSTLPLSSGRVAHWIGETAARVASAVKSLVRGAPVRWGGASFRLFRDEALLLLRRKWPMLALATLANVLTDLLLLVVALRAVGVGPDELSVIQAFAAWSIVRVLAEFPLTPGGLGVVEVALSGILVGFGADNDAAVAGVLIYRFLQFAPTLGVGLLAGATWRRGAPRP
jgi:uncharacterized membrane protein YbhN (UPF0104 family)